jgi:hypothetical protein
MTTNLTKRDPRDLDLPGFRLTSTAAVPIGRATLDQWRAAMQFVSRCETGVQFWRGDLLNYGYAAYGELASQEDGDGLPAYGTLRNEKWVAERVPVSLRSDKLTFEHHKVVAPLEPHEQKRWLSEAAERQWPVSELRAAIQGDQPNAGDWQEKVLRAVEHLRGTLLNHGCNADTVSAALASVIKIVEETD